MRRAKIVCTLGPATSSLEAIEALARSGMDCARLNFSHGDHETHLRLARWVREVAQRVGRPLALLGDLSGPKMRVGRFPGGAVELAEGQRFVLTTADVPGDAERASVSYAALPRDVRAGDAILLDDGLIRMVVESVDGEDVVCRVEVGGTLSDRKGVNLPGAKLSTPALTEKDQNDLAFAVDEADVDFVALSFVRTPDDVVEAKRLAKGTPVVAKVEKPEAVERLEEILDVADGIMVARGDLGVEVGSEKVPLMQKRIIRATNARGKLVITATQMLDSMIRNPRPTRAEAADVANAVLDGTDALMLSGETAAGKYPVQAVGMMDAIIREVEADWIHGDLRSASAVVDSVHDWADWEFANAAALSAALLSSVLPMKAIVVFTRYGRSAQLVAEHRPRAPIVAITADEKSANRLAVEWGVTPRVEVPPDDLEETLRIATAVLVREKLCERGDAFALVTGWPVSARTNTVKLHRL